MVAGRSQRQAYLSAGYTCCDEAADAAAPRLLGDVRVARRIAELQGKAAEKVEITVELISQKLLDAYDAALRFEQAGAAVAAMTALSRLLGLNASEKLDVTRTIPMPVPFPVDKTEYTVEEWVAKWSPKEIEHEPAEPNSHGHDNGD